MKTGKIQISNRDRISKILNSNKYLILLLVIIFLIIDYDLFSSQPVLLKTEGLFWKGIAIVFQIVFIGTLIKWEIKKRNIIEIVHDGVVIEGKYKYGEKIKSNRTSFFYLHLFEYSVADKTYEVTLKNKSKNVKSNYIIYQFNNPENGVVYDELKKELKSLIKDNLRELE